MPTPKPTPKEFYPKNRKEWRKWLEKNHVKEYSVGLVMYKKESGVPTVTWVEAVEEALCFGWIDSKAVKRDEHSWVHYYSKRKAKSNWSKINKDKVVQMTKDGLMAPAGLEVVKQAKASGTWDASNHVEALEVPDDLHDALKKNKAALENFTAFAPSAKKIILYWIATAKRPETREKRIAETVEKAAKNIKANQPVR